MKPAQWLSKYMCIKENCLYYTASMYISPFPHPQMLNFVKNCRVIKHPFDNYVAMYVQYRSKVTSHLLAIFPQVKRILDRVTSGSSGKPRKCLTQYSRIGKSRVHRVSSTRGLEALSGRLEGLS